MNTKLFKHYVDLYDLKQDLETHIGDLHRYAVEKQHLEHVISASLIFWLLAGKKLRNCELALYKSTCNLITLEVDQIRRIRSLIETTTELIRLEEGMGVSYKQLRSFFKRRFEHD